MGTNNEIIQLGAPMLVMIQGRVILAEIRMSASLVIVEMTTKRTNALVLDDLLDCIPSISLIAHKLGVKYVSASCWDQLLFSL